MKTRILFALILLLTSALAFAQKTIPTCNSFDPTGIPIFSTANPPDTTGTQLCTDYFGKANYANSPLPIGGADISATGFMILDGGSGYSAAPTVTITDYYNTPGAAGAAATVTVDPLTGAILTITGTAAGSGYVAPVVNITDPTGTGAIILAKLDPATVVPGTGIRKFVPTDLLPSLPLAVADTTTFSNSDYYEIALVEYTQQMHADLPPTKLRGYVQVPTGTTACPTNAAPQYLGPVILAQRNRPVRVKFMNCLPIGAGGDLQIPTDTTYMGAGLGPDNTAYTQNRATLHLHGGNTPWISDGTPHQWTAPANELTSYKKGVATQNVPDMFFVGGAIVPQCSATVTTNCSGGTAAQLPAAATTDPGDGNMTFYWTNQQGGRLMFYHDHAYGITRLNVYAGEAAGYLLYDPAEETALLNAGVPGTVATNGTQTAPDLAHLVPLVIQDKSFVPSASQLAGTDNTWIWGSGTAAPGANGNGDLWYPHVYLPNQNPADLAGANGVGRWDYGPWFFPPQTALSAAGPGPLGANSAVTIPCTSAAFPGVILQPTAADNYKNGCPITPNPSGTPEAFMDTPLVNGKAYPVLHVAPAAYRFRVLSAGNDRTLNLNLYLACGSGTFNVTATNCSVAGAAGTEVPMVPAVRGGLGTSGYTYPDQLDGRDAGVPDKLAAGPPFLEIGTEGGLLPGVAVIPPTPIGYEYNRRSITVLNVSNHGLLLGPAERADVVVDFSTYSGKTLILYNDAPAPVPAFDSRIDYYTGDPDQVTSGGAPTTIPGYGPNTRTIMQIVVDGNAPNAVPFSLASLQAALPVAFSASNAGGSKQAIVPEPTYPVASGGNAPTATYGRISDNTITYTPLGAAAPTTISYEQKAIQELFTLDYGRMNATLGTEIPLTNFLTQTTLPFGYPEWATEIIKDSTNDPAAVPQIWKLTHNGVDTHFIHFHLFNVQVINRVGWDGMVKPPDANELGWKDTVRMNPLEDIVVALQPYAQVVPFPLPDSIRSLDVTMPDNVISPAISGIDPATGNAIAGGLGTTNAKVNFGQEYVWHCHILGHEENDMMRPIIFQVAPPAPSNFSAVQSPGQVVLTWTDNSASESGFDVQKDVDPAFPNPVTVFTNANASVPSAAFGGAITYTDTSASPAGPLYYRLRAQDDFMPQSPLAPPFQVQPMFSAWVTTMAGAMTTTSIVAPPITYGQNGLVTVNVTSAAGTVTGNVTLSVDGGAPITQALVNGSTQFTILAPAAGSHTLAANYAAQGTFAASSANGVLLVNPAALTITASSTSIPYGSPVPAITSTITGLVNGDTVASLGTITCTTTYKVGSPAGTYSSSCSGAVNPNYTITYVNGTVTVTGVPLTITASSATVPYGSPVPAITPSVVGLINGDTVASLGPLACSTTAKQGSPVGIYPSSCSGAVNANYTITYVSGTVTITAVPLTITANNATRPVNTPNPAFTVTSAGFVNGDTLASLAGTLVCTTTATLTSPAGTYPITCTGLTSVNYTITWVPGVLTVTANGPILTLAPTALTFTSTANVTSASQPITVSNTGTGALRITGIALGGANVARFGLTHNCPIGGTGLAAGASCTVNVTFTPNNNPVTRTALVRVNVAAPAVSGTVSLTGKTTQATVGLSATSLAFGNVPINTTSTPQTVTVTNTGAVPLIFNSITLGGTNPARFAQTNNCSIGGLGLAPGSSCTITVTFHPTRRVARSATLTIRDNGAGSPQTIALTGTGI